MTIKFQNEALNGTYDNETIAASLDYGIANWEDEECLTQYLKFLDRIEMTNSFVPDDDGVIRSQILYIKCGDQIMSSAPLGLQWPLVMVPGPVEGEAVN